MTKRIIQFPLFALAMIGCLLTLATMRVAAQQAVQQPAQPPQPKAAGSPPVATLAQSKVNLKLERGGRVLLRNRFGPIVITGWDRDTIEATAASSQGPEAVQIEMTTDPSSSSKVTLSTAVNINPRQASKAQEAPKAQKEQKAKEAQKAQTARQSTGRMTGQATTQTTTPTPAARGERRRPGRVSVPSIIMRSDREIRLEVKLPRYAILESVDSRRYAIVTGTSITPLTTGRNDVTVTGIDGPVSVISSGNVNASRVGAIEVRTRTGNVEVQSVEGTVYVAATSGVITVREARGDVRAVSINGDINIECARGRVDANNTRGSITLNSIGGDVDAATTGGNVLFTGAIRSEGRYRLKSMAGEVLMAIQMPAPGFTATLSSYNGQVEADVPLKIEMPAQSGPVNRRLIGRYGDGGAQITLDSFSRTVRLTRAQPGSVRNCR